MYFRPQSFAPGPSKAVSNDGADGANKVLENLNALLGVGDRAGALAAARGFAQAAGSGTAALDSGTVVGNQKLLPRVELVDSKAGLGKLDIKGLGSGDSFGGMNEALKSLVEAASKMADPFGFLHAVFEFLQQIAMVSTDMMTEGLQSIDLYNQAAEASLDQLARAS